jgi:glycosyltransferase involved in cell wall biosynthesis
METDLVRRADVLIAVSEVLQAKLARMGRSAHLLTHGVDLQYWTETGDAVALPQLAGLEPPFVVFWGVIDQRLDVAWVRRLAADLQHGTLVFAGPVNDPDPGLFSLGRVAGIGSLPFEHLPALARRASVLIMPYADMPVTRAIQPLKLKEYLATGKPVVVRNLPANRPWADCLDLADNSEQFSAAVRLRLAEGLPDDQRAARFRLSAESWQDKARAFAGMLTAARG